MAGRAFKVPIPKSYNNVTEAKLVQKGPDVWVQLPANLVQDRRMSRKSTYMQDYNRSIPNRHRNVKAKVISRHTTYPHPSTDFLVSRNRAVPRHANGSSFDVDTSLGFNTNTRGGKNRLTSGSFEGMSEGTQYAGMRSKHNEPITAFLPVMNGVKTPELRMQHHYSSGSGEGSYNDKARTALPGAAKWLTSNDNDDTLVSKHSGTIDGDNFLENPLTKPDLIDHEQKRSVTIRSPRMRTGHTSRSALGKRLDEGHAILDAADHTVSLHPPAVGNSAKRHELEILTKVHPTDPHPGVSALDHLYQPGGYNTKSGYTVVDNAYEHGNATFYHTSGGSGSFTIAPDWMSERKKAVVIRH